MSQVAELLRGLSRWWCQEWRNLIPDKPMHWLLGRGRGLLAIAPQGETLDLELRSDRGEKLASLTIQRASFRPDAIDGFLAAHGFDRNEVDLGIRLPQERFFTRRLNLPAAASRAVDEIATQDLARKTPFRLADVFCGHTHTRASGGDKITVLQWVVRREIVTQAIEAVDVDPAQVAFVDVEAKTDGPSPFLWLRQNRSVHRSWTVKVALALGCLAVVLASAHGGLRYWRQQAVLDDLDAQIAIARPKAQKVRAVIDEIEKGQKTLASLRARKRDVPGLIDLWEETTRVLPSHSWVTELRLVETSSNQEQQLVVTGFSTTATQLVSLIDRSPLFSDVALTAPIALDPVEGRERFALQAKVKKLEARKEASR